LHQTTTAIGSENTKIKIKYNNNGVPGSKGYLDYINVVAKRNYKVTENNSVFNMI
jgi:hypothetical protein